MRLHVVLAIALATGCVKQVQQALAPEPSSAGTLSCGQVVQQCDSACSDPLCLHNCTSQGTADAQGPHAALLDCGQRNACTDQACMEASCSGEIAACMGPPAATPGRCNCALACDCHGDDDPQRDAAADQARRACATEGVSCPECPPCEAK